TDRRGAIAQHRDEQALYPRGAPWGTAAHRRIASGPARIVHLTGDPYCQRKDRDSTTPEEYDVTDGVNGCGVAAGQQAIGSPGTGQQGQIRRLEAVEKL